MSKKEMQDNAIPKAQIKDKDAYELYQQLSKHPILNDLSKITDSRGRTINLGMTVGNLRKNIADLTPVEQKKILALKQKHYDIMCKRNGAQRRAFGTIVNKHDIPSAVAVDRLDAKKVELIELFGKMFTAKEVHQIVLETFRMGGVTLAQVETFRKTYSPEINNKIEEHKRSFSDIRLGYKRSRLEELSWMYMKRKRIYEITNKPDDHRLLLATIEQIRKEAEGDMIKIDANLNLSMEEGIQEHINKNILKFINLKEIILSRVAAKRNISPLSLIEAMNKSFYQNTLDDPDQAKNTNYPSLQTYDFDKIKRIQLQKEQIQEAEVIETKVNQVEVAVVESKAKGIKEVLLERLAKKNQELNRIKNDINSELIDKTNNI